MSTQSAPLEREEHDETLRLYFRPVWLCGLDGMWWKLILQRPFDSWKLPRSIRKLVIWRLEGIGGC